jgi:FKBP-type peptidyl-prolyl cis-trans isomerase FkpA
MKKLVVSIVLVIISLMISCSDTADEDQLTILNYLDTRGLVAIDTGGVYVVISTQGGTDQPEETSSVQFSYKGYYPDGKVFDQSPSDYNPTVKLSSLITGLRYGIAKFGKNSKGSILIPSDLGYGSNPPLGIRKNSILIYDIHLFDFY